MLTQYVYNVHLGVCMLYTVQPYEHISRGYTIPRTTRTTNAETKKKGTFNVV